MSKVIIGGGLSGLSSAYYLSKLAPNQKISLVEASSRLGGWIRSEKLKNGIIFEQGPRTIRPVGEIGINTLNLVEELNLSGEVVPVKSTSPAAKNRMIYADGELHCLPNSLLSLFKTQKPFSKPLIVQLLKDFKAKPKIIEDESIYDFTKRRFGDEVADYLISPMICGICAGNSREISVNFLMKTLFEYEQRYGSVAMGIYKHAFEKRNVKITLGNLAHRSRLEKWNVYSFKNGMETLTKSLENVVSSIGTVDIQKSTHCVSLEFKNNKEVVVHRDNGKKIESEHIISCIAATNLAPLLERQHPNLSKLLNKIKSVTVAVVNLHFKGNLIKNPGFGFLVPPKEKLPILGIIFDSCCYTYEDSTVLTAMMGGHWFKEQFGDNPSEEILLETASKHIKKILGIYEVPEDFRVNILKDCIPQYVVGHQKNLRDIECYIKDSKLPLSLCGSSYEGVGLNNVIWSARNVAHNLGNQQFC